MGDFNFRTINWRGNHRSLKENITSKQESMLLQFMETNLLSQYVLQPTRKSNILDLFITNNDNLVLQTTCEETPLSDHDIVFIQTTYDIKSKNTCNIPHFADHTFRSLNLQKADFEEINSQLTCIDWDNFKSICTA